MSCAARKGKHRYRGVVFPRRTLHALTSSLSLSSKDVTTTGVNPSFPSSDLSPDDPVSVMSEDSDFIISDLFTSFPVLCDLLHTETSQRQDETIIKCLPLLSGEDHDLNYNEHGVLSLNRKRHISFLIQSMRKLPAQFVAADASRPWIFYWCLNGLVTMGHDVSGYEKSLVATIRPIQNLSGGFGGGHGQMSHLAPTYAIVLALAIVGGPESFDILNRRAIWKWLCSLKQFDGGFQMAVDGEEDVRGAYCAVVIIALLNLPIELSQESSLRKCGVTSLLTALPEWISRCQSFEGGIAARPDAEAHGAYTFCALACLCMLGEPHIIIPQYLNVPLLVSWLSARQYAPEGGFSGRTNKLVDGCYSHWVGGCWPLIEACLDGLSSTNLKPSCEVNNELTSQTSVGHLYNREGLIRYILCCCQDLSKRGGLRDKPGLRSDSYHTCYVLAGLSSAQNKWHFGKITSKEVIQGHFSSAFSWSSEAYVHDKQIYNETDRLNTLHPIFVIPEVAVRKMQAYFESKVSF